MNDLSICARHLSLSIAFDAYRSARARGAPEDRMEYLRRRYAAALINYLAGRAGHDA